MSIVLPPPHIFRAYDIRGIAHLPKTDKTPELTPESIYQIGLGAGVYFKQHGDKQHGDKNLDRPKIAVSYDCRVSNPELAQAFIEGLRAVGCEVTVIGMVPTPMLYFAVCRFGFDGGAAVTASHNPKEYNGVKLVGREAHSICGEELQEVYHLIQSKFSSNNFNKDKTRTEPGKSIKKSIDENGYEWSPEKADVSPAYLDVFPAYLEKILEIVSIERSLKIVVDSGNGATGPYVKPFFEALGCEVIPLFTEPDGNFPNHEANPEDLENMHALIAAVKTHRADLGLGFDGDGDRVGVVDEKGHHYQADLLLLQLARELLKKIPGSKIVFDSKVSQVLIDDIKKYGGEPVMSKTGHSFIERKMREVGAPLAGEISGHLFFAGNYYGFDDAFLGAARLLEILAQSKKPFSKLFEDVPQMVSTPELKSPCPDNKKFDIVQKIAQNLSARYPSITIDGIRVNFDAHSWGAVRASNTSPNLTLRFEAPSQTRLKEIIHTMLEELEKYPEIDLWWASQFK